MPAKSIKKTFFLAARKLVSLAAVFCAVTQRSPQKKRCVTAQKMAARETTRKLAFENHTIDIKKMKKLHNS